MHREIEQRGAQIDYLVNNAGYGSFGLFAESPLDYELAMMRLNMETLTVLSKLLLPSLIARRGKILNVASTAAFQPGPYMAVYFATKAYVLSFSEAIQQPHAQARQWVVQVPTSNGGSQPQMACPIRFSHTPSSYRNTGGPVGEHNQEILTELQQL